MQQTEDQNLEPRTSNLVPDSKPRTSNLEPDVTQSGQDLLDFLLVIAKHKKMILLTTLVAAIISVILSLSLSNVYTATTMILPGEEDKGIMGAMMAQMGGLAGIAGDALGGKTKADLYATMLKSETVKDAIIDRFKLMEIYQAKYRMSVYKTLDRVTKIVVGKKDGVIRISVSDKDPKRAANMANSYVAELGKFAVKLNSVEAGNNRAFLEKKIAETRSDLAQAEDALKNFQSKSKAISISDQAKATIEGVSQLRAQMAIQEVQLATLQRQFTDSSQEVKSAKAIVANLRAQLAGLEGKGGGSSSIPNVGNVPGLGQEYMRLMREFKIQEAVLELLVKQYEMTSLSEAKDISPLQVIQIAKPPENRSKPSRKNIVLVLTFCGFFFSSSLAYGLDRIKCMSGYEKERWNTLIDSCFKGWGGRRI